MAGENLLNAVLENIQRQGEVAGSGAAYPVYVNDYGNYGNWYDCKGYH